MKHLATLLFIIFCVVASTQQSTHHALGWL